jgi:hypothetical protein
VTVISTIWSDDAEYNRRVKVLDWRALGWPAVTREMGRAGPDDVIIINGALGFSLRWRDMLSACVLRAVGRGSKLVVADATWEPRSEAAESTAGRLWPVNDRWTRSMARYLTGTDTVFCFLSRREVDQFHVDLGDRTARAAFTSFYVTAPPWHLRAGHDWQEASEPYVFTGGNTLRNWGLLTDALADCGVPVHVATRHTERSWPANFVVGPLDHEEFFRVATGATAGVLALRDDMVRSAGQQTYLNLLGCGVPVVVNDAPGVRDHLDDIPGAWVTGPDDADAIRRRVLWLCDDANRAQIGATMARARRMVAVRFSEAAYLARLVDVAESMLATRPAVERSERSA